MLGDASKVVVAKGKKTLVFDMKKSPDMEELTSVALGPTGNLRAPTVKRGKTYLVGFSEAAYDEYF